MYRKVSKKKHLHWYKMMSWIMILLIHKYRRLIFLPIVKYLIKDDNNKDDDIRDDGGDVECWVR